MTKSKKNAASKTQVVFNEDDRAKYLLGFRKRKMERKLKARDEIDNQIRAEKQRQRDLKAQAIMDEEKTKVKVPKFENKLTKREVIETASHTIVVSDISDMNKIEDSDDESVNDDLIDSVAKDAQMTKSQAKLSKECALIEDRLAKLEKQKRQLDNIKSKTKMKKLLKKSRQAAKGSKASKKHQIKEDKIKLKAKIKLKKKLNKKQN